MIRNIIFFLFFYLGIISISILFIPTLFFPKKGVQFGGRLMGIWTGICLKLFLGVNITVKVLENIPKEKKYFVVCSHQSMFETFFLQTIFNSPVFILKKELLMIPIFGWYLKKIGSISIKRNKVSKENINFFEDISKIIANTNRPIIIFPQGTRVLPHEQPPFKKGASRIYEELKIKCQPVAINSGYVWPKKGKKGINKTITISILEPIKPDYSKEEFLGILEKTIYSELKLLN